MKYALYLGCWIQTQQYNYELSTRKTLPKLDVELADIDDFSCCGYPLRSYDDSIWLYLGARNLALAEREELDILPLCNGCYCSLSEVKHILDENEEIKEKVNLALSEEDLKYKGAKKIRHILEVLHQDIGIKKIQDSIEKKISGVKFATHCGCHAVRPSAVRFTDDPEDPIMLEELTQAVGIETPYYPEKMDCCGASLILSNFEAAFKLTGYKIHAIQERGFDGVVTNCPFCLKMLDSRQDASGRLLEKEFEIPVYYITQIIGLALGFKEDELGLNFNQSPVDVIASKFEVI
jgi:heterodisulfide reductase subunit B